MSALTVPARPAPGAAMGRVPWRRMTWVVWRRNRLALAGVGVLLGGAALYLVVTGLSMHHAYAGVAGCRPAGSPTCQRVANDFSNASAYGAGITSAVLQLVPALIGAFAGAPLLAAELETGTFRYAWTQGVGRVRWTIAMLAPLAVAVTAAAALFGVLFSWWSRPLFGAFGRSPMYPTMFDLRGVALAGWTLAAFAIGALAGVLIRRVVPAMFATLAAWVGLAFASGAYLRQRYEAPLVTSNPDIGSPAWVLHQWWTRGGKPVGLSALNRALLPDGVTAVTPTQFQPHPGGPAGQVDPVQYLVHHGFTQLTTFQPAARFWPFQWIEGGWLLALSLLLITATVWVVRHRAA